MLQIASGKLFENEVGHVNNLTGVVFSNLNYFVNGKIDVGVGFLSPCSPRDKISTAVWEFEEKIEKPDHGGPAVLRSNGIRHYLNDYLVLMSFGLNILCANTPDSIVRMCNTPENEIEAPKKLLYRFFDSAIQCQHKDLNHLRDTNKSIIGLQRKKYILVMRAIRNYVAALHRMIDDLDLAYTLLIMSIEALAQESKPEAEKWSNYSQDKRIKIDQALEGIDKGSANKVRDAILENDHSGVIRKFHAFVMSHLPVDYFKHTAENLRIVGKQNLLSCLENLYGSRSKYVHTLNGIPSHIIRTGRESEYSSWEGQYFLTFQGLARLARSLILEYINRQDQVDRESYDYTLENPNISTLKLAPELWVGRTGIASKENGVLIFNAYISHICSSYEKPPAPRVDIRDTLSKGLEFLHSSKDKQMRPYICLLGAFNCLVSEAYRVNYKSNSRILSLMNNPSIESLCAHAVLGADTEWDSETHRKILDNYYKQRGNASGIRVPSKLESCMDLSLVERYRLEGLHEHAKSQIHQASINNPNIMELRELSELYNPEKEMEWLNIIFPEVLEPENKD